MSELEIAVRLKNKGYTHMVQFLKEGEKFGDPIGFKKASEIGPFLRENPDLRMAWSENIEEYINDLG